MTGDIVNLRKARKAKAKVAKGQAAQENRVRFGRTKAERARDEDTRSRIERELDGARRGKNEDDDGNIRD